MEIQQESVFLTYVRCVLQRWTGFQLAIDNGMGGPDAKEKEVWLGTEIENYFKTYDDVQPDDIEDYIGAILEAEFQTYFEDGSIMEISRKFCHAFALSQTNPESQIFQKMSRASEPCHPAKLTSKAESVSNKKVEEDSVIVAEMKELTLNGELKLEPADSWITVKKGRKK